MFRWFMRKPPPRHLKPNKFIKFTVGAVKKISIFFGKEVLKQMAIEFVQNLPDLNIL